MARFYPTNRYIGVNAHLNSYLQQPNGMWQAFYAEMIIALRRYLQKVLPPNYSVVPEQGLQIKSDHEGLQTSKSIAPDINIFQKSPSQYSQSLSNTNPTATILFAELDYLDLETEYFSRISVYKRSESDLRGELVTVIELLSPSNKPHGSNYKAYSQKRIELMQAKIKLVEIDFLHETRPIIPQFPAYPQDEGAFPYNILVNIPYPDFAQGKFDWYGVAVDKPLPDFALPLAGNETCSFDLQQIYNDLMEDAQFLSELVDYDTLPVNFEAYTPEDQQRINTILEAIRQEA